MDEHDDDLESEVIEGAEIEVDAFPDTGDELDDDEASDKPEDERPVVDDDPAEL
jgi:hypothetical protein